MTKQAGESTSSDRKLIDFRDLRDTARGEELEALTECILKRLGHETNRVGRGPDGGKDLICSERVSGDFVTHNRRWLVQCKHPATSGKAVSEKEVGSIADLCVKHGADGFLLVTTTVVTKELGARIEAFTADRRQGIVAGVWDEHRLREILLRREMRDVLKRFLPDGYARVATLEPEAILVESLREKGLTDDELDEVQASITSGLEAAAQRMQKLESHDIYLAATSYRAVIDDATALFLEGKTQEAADHLEELPFEEWEACISRYIGCDKQRTEDLLRLLAERSGEEDRRYAAVRRLVEGWGYELFEMARYARTLDRESIRLLMHGSDAERRIVAAVERAIFDQDPKGFDELPPHQIDEVTFDAIEYVSETDEIRSELELTVGIVYMDGDGTSDSYPCTTTATVTSSGEVSVGEVVSDTSKFFAGRDDEDGRG